MEDFEVNASGQSLIHEMAAVSAVATFCGSSRGMAWFISLCTDSVQGDENCSQLKYLVNKDETS